MIRRTIEPFGKIPGLKRLFIMGLRVAPKTSRVSYAPTWRPEGDFWGPTAVVRLPLCRYALGFGIWIDVNQEDIMAVHEEDAEYERYTEVNGLVPREQWLEARRKIAEMGMDPDEEMELMQAMGVFQ